MSAPVDLQPEAADGAGGCWRGAFQLEFDPLVFRRDVIFVQQQRAPSGCRPPTSQARPDSRDPAHCDRTAHP